MICRAGLIRSHLSEAGGQLPKKTDSNELIRERSVNCPRRMRKILQNHGVPILRTGRVRFAAPSSEADTFVERIYLDCGLVSCSRHNVKMTVVWIVCVRPFCEP